MTVVEAAPTSITDPYGPMDDRFTTAGPPIGEIVARLQSRRAEQGKFMAVQREVRDTYNADIAVPLPELDSDERAAVANLLQQGLDGTAQRIASTQPDAFFPPLRPTIRGSVLEARTRRQVTLGWWEMNDMDLIDARRSRHLIGYACSPVNIRPDTKRRIPKWEARDPMSSYPSPPAHLDDMRPTDVIFTFMRPWQWLRRMYPAETAGLFRDKSTRADTLFECVEYIDGDVLVLGVIGEGGSRQGSPLNGGQAGAYRDTRNGRTGRQRNVVVGSAGMEGYHYAVELERLPNRAETCTAVVPGRITLDRLMGQFDGMIGKYIWQARLQALELIAIEEGIWPQMWLISRPNENPEVITVANGRKGVVGEIRGADIHVNQVQPGYKTDSAIDRLTEAQRQEGGINAAMTGESAGNIRTGRRGDAILANQIDFGIQENQKILARSKQHEIEIAIAVRKGFFRGETSSFYVSWKGAKGNVDLKAGEFEKVFSTDRCRVKYAMAGSDLNGQIVRVGQKLGTGLWSLKTAREQDPETEDPEGEAAQVMLEELERSVLTEISQPGSMSVADKARVGKLLAEQKLTIFEAVDRVNREAQVRQATSGPPGTPEGPVEPGAPEAQPGITQPGQGEEAGAIPAPTPSAAHLGQLLNGLRTVRSQAVAGERSGL